MISLSINKNSGTPLRILCLGAHSDDIEIGCGGTLLKLIETSINIEIWWVVFCARDQRKIEAQNSANEFLKDVAHRQVILKDFRDGFFPYIGTEVKDFFEELKSKIHPDLIFTHYRHDLHQDHRMICELTWNTYRDHFILEYEIPKYDGDLGSPNAFVHLDREICEKKIANITANFLTQESRHWFSGETFMALLTLRGIESRSPSSYAEAFYSRKNLICLV
jgi:LmbE family N-acetylglucosaminyl deacetylase